MTVAARQRRVALLGRAALGGVALGSVLLGTACGGDSRRPDGDSAAAAAANTASATAAVAGSAGDSASNACPKDGRWRPCGLKERLEKAGLVVTPKDDTVRYEFLAVPGLRYVVGRGEVQAFFYDDTTRLARDVAALDTVRVAPAGTLRHWDVPPTFVRSANLVVILLTASEQLMERGQFAIQAGPPQPEPPPTAQQLPPARVP